MEEKQLGNGDTGLSSLGVEDNELSSLGDPWALQNLLCGSPLDILYLLFHTRQESGSPPKASILPNFFLLRPHCSSRKPCKSLIRYHSGPLTHALQKACGKYSQGPWDRPKEAPLQEQTHGSLGSEWRCG